MGASGKWVESLIGLKKTEKEDQEKVSGKIEKRKLWSSSRDLGTSWKGFKGKFRADSVGSDSSPGTDAFNAAMAAVLRAPPKDFRVVRQEWAAIRTQTLFVASGKKGFESFKRNCEASSISPWSTGEETGCCDT